MWWALFWVWFVGWIAMQIYGRWRVLVNARKGLIANPDDPLAFFSLAVVCMAWPYLAPKIAYLWWRDSR